MILKKYFIFIQFIPYSEIWPTACHTAKNGVLAGKAVKVLKQMIVR
jgi:hypothetical protein